MLNARWWNSYGSLNAAAYKCTRFTYGWKRHLSLLISPPPPPENIFSFPYQVTDPQIAFPWLSWTQNAFLLFYVKKAKKKQNKTNLKRRQGAISSTIRWSSNAPHSRLVLNDACTALLLFRYQPSDETLQHTKRLHNRCEIVAPIWKKITTTGFDVCRSAARMFIT